MSRIVRFLLIVLVCAPASAESPKNVILMIADGVGPAHYTVMRTDRGAEFNIARMPVIGLTATSAANRYVTDSAAGATALATGRKTNYEMVGVDPDGTPLTSVLQIARSRGKAGGLVTTADFWDATPAAFAAHSGHRRSYLEIVRQMLGGGTELIASGGLEYFGTDTLPPAAELASEFGYSLVTSPEGLPSAGPGKILVVVPGQERDLDHPELPLPALTRWAIERLAAHPGGFFLVVEHEGTDSSSHQNNTADLRKSLISFDEAVGVALDFASNRKDTLVVVTSDHETGGLRITETAQLRRMRLEWSTTDHTATMVPIFAFGPGSHVFGRIVENNEVGVKLREAVLAGGSD